MDEYQGLYEEQFVRNLKRYSSMRERIRKKIELILDDPYDRTEYLEKCQADWTYEVVVARGFVASWSHHPIRIPLNNDHDLRK